MSQRNKATR